MIQTMTENNGNVPIGAGAPVGAAQTANTPPALFLNPEN